LENKRLLLKLTDRPKQKKVSTMLQYFNHTYKQKDKYLKAYYEPRVTLEADLIILRRSGKEEW